MAPSSLRDEPWYVRAFDRSYLRIYPHRDEAEAEANADAILKHLGVRSGQRVLDVACGAGRYARAFARRGLRVTGIDLSDDLLDEARAKGRLLPGAPLFVCRDARQLPFANQFDGAVSIFTSFGYFDAVEDDRKIFRGVARALVAGGRFLLDYLNESQVRSALVEKDEIREGALRVSLERRIDEEAPSGPVVVKQVDAVDASSGQHVASFEERVRLYTLAEIDALLTQAGMVPVGEPMGDVHGAPLDALSERLVRVAEKPRR